MTDADDLPPFALPTGPRQPADIVARLIRVDEHRHLADNEISIGYLMRTSEKEKGGKLELGSVHDVKHMAQGAFKELFAQLLEAMLGELPQFVMVLDAGWWAAASDRDAEALIWHELCHVKQATDRYGAPRFDMDGRPVYKLREHDVSAFNSEVARYGTWSPDLIAFVAAAQR